MEIFFNDELEDEQRLAYVISSEIPGGKFVTEGLKKPIDIQAIIESKLSVRDTILEDKGRTFKVWRGKDFSDEEMPVETKKADGTISNEYTLDELKQYLKLDSAIPTLKALNSGEYQTVNIGNGYFFNIVKK